MMKACPQCGSDQFKKASLVHEEGTGVAVGVGISASGSVGIAGGGTASALALRCAPPKAPSATYSRSTGIALFVWLVPLVFANFEVGSISAISGFWKAWFAVGLIVTGRYWLKDEREREKLHSVAIESYNRTYICTRCGTFSKPFE